MKINTLNNRVIRPVFKNIQNEDRNTASHSSQFLKAHGAQFALYLLSVFQFICKKNFLLWTKDKD